jgi:hypothetical protein
MVKKRAFLALMLASTLAGSSSAALAARESLTRPALKSPIVISHNPQLNAPMTALFFVGDRLLNVLRAVRGVGMLNLPTVGTGNQTYGIQDGPDGVDPLGAKDHGLSGDGAAPLASRTPIP